MFSTLLQRSSDGSDTLFVPELDEHFHSVNGALTEALHVYLQQGFLCSHGEEERRVLEVGFGTGLNGLVTLLEAHRRAIPTRYYAIEKYPLSPVLLRQLNYPGVLGEGSGEWFRAITEAPWGRPIRLSPLFELTLLKEDFITSALEGIPRVNVVYYDAFAPGKQPEMWNEALFRKLYGRMAPGGVLVTYCAQGNVRRAMASAGLRMERLPGPPGKREMLRGIKPD